MSAIEVEMYIRESPEEFRATLIELRSLIRTQIPDSEETMDGRFPTYTVNGEWTAGFAWRKKGTMLYIMKSGVLDRYEQQLGRLRSGRSCVEWKPSKTMSLDELRQLAQVMLADAAKA